MSEPLMEDHLVGFLVLEGKDNKVYCEECAPKSVHHMTALYHSNVYPYSQDCAKCHKCLVIGALGMCILFDGKDK